MVIGADEHQGSPGGELGGVSGFVAVARIRIAPRTPTGEAISVDPRLMPSLVRAQPEVLKAWLPVVT